jgi:hypothetical protein
MDAEEPTIKEGNIVYAAEVIEGLDSSLKTKERGGSKRAKGKGMDRRLNGTMPDEKRNSQALTLEELPEFTPEFFASLTPEQLGYNEIEIELKEQGIDVMSITPEQAKHLSTDVIEKIRESLRRKNTYPRCWHPMEESEHVPMVLLSMLREDKRG